MTRERQLTNESQTMKKESKNSSQPRSWGQSNNRAGARIVLLVSVAFILGLASGGYFYYRHTKAAEVPISEPTVGTVLSDSTQAILQRLDAPVDIKFYSPSDAAALPETLGAFTARVKLLLTEYERAGAGNIRLRNSDPALEPSAKTAAGADGILPFTGQNGEICYLGITISRGARKETIPQVSPDWEAALESDLSRAIARVSASVAVPAVPATQVSTIPSPVDPAISEELLRTIPDLDSRSFDDAAKILRASALAEFTAAVRVMQTKVQEAERELAAAQGNKSEADQHAAMKQLQQVQAAESKKLSEITAQLQARITALERLKGVNRSTPK